MTNDTETRQTKTGWTAGRTWQAKQMTNKMPTSTQCAPKKERLSEI